MGEFGLMFFNARWLDPALGRFAQADTLIPEASQGTQAWDRYAAMNNNPIRYFDPTGHKACDGKDDTKCESIESAFKDWEVMLLAAVIFSESSNGTYPKSMEMIGWVYLNRVTYGTFSNITDASGPGQSALISSLENDFPWLSNLLTLSRISLNENLMTMNNNMMMGGNKAGWLKSVDIAISIVINYDVF